jgi:hypothetical protein
MDPNPPHRNKADLFLLTFGVKGAKVPIRESRSKLLLIFMMFFAIIPNFKCYLCPKTLGKAKQAIKLR